MGQHKITSATAEKLGIHEFDQQFNSSYKSPCLKSVMESLLMARGYLIYLNEKSQGYGMYESLALGSVTDGIGVLQDIINTLERQQNEQMRLIGRREPEQAVNYCKSAMEEVHQRWLSKQQQKTTA